jgi:hypothetical protein
MNARSAAPGAVAAPGGLSTSQRGSPSIPRRRRCGGCPYGLPALPNSRYCGTCLAEHPELSALEQPASAQLDLFTLVPP